MAQNDNELSVALPDELRRQFDRVERRLWRVETTVALCQILGALVVSFLCLFISDRFWETPVWLRAGLLAAALIACAWAIFRWLRVWVLRRRDLRALANLVQKTYRRLGDRLLGIVELASEQRHLSNFSPALYHAAIQQVADEARNYDFRASVSSKPAKNHSLALGSLFTCLLGALLVLPHVSSNVFQRWISPFSPTARYTLVSVEGLPQQLIVPHGEAFSISAQVQYRAFWKPRHAAAVIARQPMIEGSVQSGAVRLQIPAQIEEGMLELRVGDARRQIKILPRYRPSLKELTAALQLPDYLRYPEQAEAVRNGALLTVEGTRFSLHGKVSRPLVSAQIQSGSNSMMPLKLQGDLFTSDFAKAEGLSQFDLSWRDDLGLTNAVPLHVAVQTQLDAPPSSDFPDMPRNVILLATDVLTIRVEARDDFGVRDLGLMWETYSDIPASGGTATTEIKVQTSSPQEKRVEKVFQWSPSLFRVAADSVVELQAYARDYFPQRERIKSPICRIQILSPEKHAELLRQQLESVLARVEEVTRLQEKIVNNTREIKESPNLTEAQKSTRLGQGNDDQLKNAANLEQLAKEGRQTMQEAIKNPMISEEAIREFTRTMQQWQKLGKENMKDAAQSLKSAQQNPSSRQKDIAEALEKEQQILKELQKQQNKNSENMDQLQAMTLAQRLRRIAGRETETSQQLFNAATETIGLLPRDVPPKFKELESTLAGGQETVSKDAEVLQGEISRFFERTQKTNYSQVSREMKEARIGDELETLGGLIRDNVAMEASGALTNWSRRFQEWGDKLEPKPEKGPENSASSQPGDQKKMDLTKQLIALLRVREKELTLREQTSLLDAQRGDSYKEQAGALRSTQQELSQELGKIQKDTPLPAMSKPFQETADAMREVEALLEKPQTDKATDQAEVKSVELLSDLINLINEQAQRPPPGQSQQQSQESSAEEMAFLTQMMKEAGEDKGKPAKSLRGGISSPSGGIGTPTAPVTGNVQGKGAGPRTVNKAAGVLESSPTEFREALDNYFHAIEQRNN